MEGFGKIIIVFNYFCKKTHLKSLRGSWIWVLNISDIWIFVNFRRYDRVLNMRCDSVIEGFWILQSFEYVRFLHNATVAQGSEYAWIMSYGRVLNMPGQRSQGFKYPSGSEYGKVVNMGGLHRVLNMPE